MTKQNNTEKINKPTWIIHEVFPVENDPENKSDHVVYHTHGLDKYGSLELEINFPFPPNQAGQFINLIGLKIANGKKFKDGDIDNTIFSCNIVFKEVKGIYGEGEKNLRVIFPDPNFKFPWNEDCEDIYKDQI